jgi:hypothetical protein
MTSKLTGKGAAFSLAIVLLVFSCKKDEETRNIGPVAVAGADRVIDFPKDSVHLDGSFSADADGTITTYHWEMVNGPQRFEIVSASTAKTAVTGLVEGMYEFQLTVTDNLGALSKDVVQVRVYGIGPCNEAVLKVISGPGELKEFGSLSLNRSVYMSAAAADKMVFAGGGSDINGNYVPTNLVDIYNLTTKTWSTAQLSRKDFQNAIPAGNRILFTGSEGNIDVYDAAANTWSVLSSNPAAGRFLHSIAVLGNKVFFAGGFSNVTPNSVVNIYDAASGTWSVAQLSEARAGMVTATVGNKLVFAGGFRKFNAIDEYAEDPSKKVDIYDGVTGSWTTADLPGLGMGGGNAATSGSKAVFAFDGLNEVSIFDAAGNSWSTAPLSIARSSARAMAVGNKILIAGGYVVNSGESSRVDIYDAVTGNWSAANMSQPGVVSWSLAVGNKLLFSVWNGTPNDGRVIEVYDAATNAFSTIRLNHPIWSSPVVGDGKVYFGGATVMTPGGQNDRPSCKAWELSLK